MRPLGPRDLVTCPRFAGKPTIPAECCVLRSMSEVKRFRWHKATYPQCATCPLGRLRRQKLEAGGWIWDAKAFRKRNSDRLMSEVRARKRILATRSADPASCEE